MALKIGFANALRVGFLGGAAIALLGCESFQEATGAAKVAPDEFTVMTKAPLIIPPDYNLHPPQPGAADRNEGDPDAEARAALFAQQDPAAAAAALGTDYSDGEKALLAKSGGATADPAVRQQIGADSGYTDQGEAYAQKVLYPQAAPAQPAQAAPPQVRGTTQ